MKNLVVRLKIAALMVLMLLAFLALPITALLWIVSGKCLKCKTQVKIPVIMKRKTIITKEKT